MLFVALAWKDRGDAAKSLKKKNLCLISLIKERCYATKINQYFSFFFLLESSTSSFRNFAESKANV